MKRITRLFAAAFGAVVMFVGSTRADYKLEHDEDWRDGRTLSGTIDLAGHKLAVNSLTGNATITSAEVSGYEILEYIDSDGSSYVDTGVTVAGNTVLDIKLQYLAKSSSYFVSYVGARVTGATSGAFGGWFVNPTSSIKHYRDLDEPTKNLEFGDVALNTDYLVHLEKSGPCTINGEWFGDGGGTGNNLPIFIFGMNQGGSVNYLGKYRVYFCTIKYGNVVQCDLRPARRLPDGALGLLDVKDPENPVFLEKKGSGTFTAGRVVSEEFVRSAELHVDVADGQTTENTTVAISGLVRVVKDGEGTFVATKQNQAYTRGTVVSAGTFRCGTYGYNHIYGADGSAVTVRDGATFDCDGWAGHANFNFILDGGAVKNETDRSFANYEILEYIDSDGNSYVETGVIVDPSTVLDIKLQYLAKSGQTFASYVGARASGARTGAFGGWFVNSSTSIKHYRDLDEPTTNLEFGDVSLNKDYLVHLEKSGDCTIDGVSFGTGSGNGNEWPIMVFAINQSGTPNYSGKYRVYFCTIKYGNVVQCDLRPARRLSDGALGLLDVKDLGAANPKFCENKGSGAFTAGPRADRSWLGDMTLTKDSALTGRDFGFSRPDWSESTLRMNDKTLTLEMTDGGVIQAGNLKVEGGGEIYAKEGGWLLLGGNPQTGDKYVRAGTTTLHMGDAAIRDVGGELVFGSYVSEYIGGSDEANTVIKVQGRFTPGTKWHATELQDGAMLDLSAYNDTWNTTCAFTDSGTTATATFAAGASVTVDLGERVPEDRMKLVAWTDAPLSTVTFRLSDAISSDDYMLERRTDGLYIMAAVKTATWTGAAGTTDCDDPANWDCRNAKGVKLDGARPGSITDVTVSGGVQFGIPASSTFSCASFTCDNVSLTGNCDWSGLSQPVNGLIDLAGHNLTVNSLAGVATITDSTKEPNLIQDGSFEEATIPASVNGGTWAYFDNGVESSCWQTPNSGDRVGITKNNSPWTTWVSGTQAAYVQSEQDRARTLQQEVQVPEDGKYLLTYYYTWRPATKLTQHLEIHVDDGPVCGYTDSGESVAVKEIVLDLTKGSHAIKFVGASKHQSAATIIDDVSLRRIRSAGELHVLVPEGRTEVNTTVAISGSVRLVKEGAGTFVATKKDQTYRGGTDVAAGTFRCGAFGYNYIYGAAGSTVTVREGATFDCDGQAEHGSFSFVLDGGTVKNMTDRGNASRSWFADMTLTKDSVMTGCGFGFIRPSWEESTLRMNGHVLTVIMVGGDIHAGNLTVEGGGEIYMQDGGWFILGGNPSSGSGGKYIIAETTTLHMGGGGAAIYDKGGDHVFGSYVSEYTRSDDGPNTVIKVLNRFVPGVKWHATELQNGATLDLSACTDTWNTTCGFGGGRTATATFAEGATIVVDLGDRKVRSSKPVVTWNEKPENVKFCVTPGRKGWFEAKDDGLYLYTGFGIIVR